MKKDGWAVRVAQYTITVQWIVEASVFPQTNSIHFNSLIHLIDCASMPASHGENAPSIGTGLCRETIAEFSVFSQKEVNELISKN